MPSKNKKGKDNEPEGPEGRNSFGKVGGEIMGKAKNPLVSDKVLTAEIAEASEVRCSEEPVEVIRAPEKDSDTVQNRKIQVSGKSTYLISLPKQWVEKVKLHSSDSIALIPLSDGTLLINPMNLMNHRMDRPEDEPARKVIDLDVQELETIRRRFIGAYLMGHTVIKFVSERTLTKEDRDVVKSITNTVMGTEIVEETSNSVTVRDLLGKGGVSISQSIKRMHLISREMLQDAFKALHDKDALLMEDVEARDEEVDKFNWMVAKQYNYILKDVFFAERMQLTPQEGLGYLFVARNIERIADHATKIAVNAKMVKTNGPNVARVCDLSVRVIELYDKAIGAFHIGRSGEANKVVEDAARVLTDIRTLKGELQGFKVDQSTKVSLAFIVDSLDRVASYAVDIAEIAINHQFILKQKRVTPERESDVALDHSRAAPVAER